MDKKSDIEKGVVIKVNKSFLNTESTSEALLDSYEEISEMQPSSHSSKKSICESFCKLLIPSYDLTIKEYKSYNALRKEALELYDEKNSTHERLLQDLMDTYIELCNDNNKKLEIGPLWKDLGFQGTNPRTDFRAGGVYSLKFMHYFAWKYSNELVDCIESDYFLFAVVSIRVCFMFKLFLNLVKDEELKISLRANKIAPCTRRQFKHFCAYLNQSKDIMLVLISRSMVFIHNKFKESIDNTKNELNFLLIDPLIQKSVKCLGSILNKPIDQNKLDSIIETEFAKI